MERQLHLHGLGNNIVNMAIFCQLICLNIIRIKSQLGFFFFWQKLMSCSKIHMEMQNDTKVLK